LVGSQQGKAVRLGLLRQGKPLIIEITLPSFPIYELAQSAVVDLSFPSEYRIGVTLAEADDTLRSQLRLAAGEGLVVTEVLPDGPALAAGVKSHDVLIKLDGQRLSTVEKINAQIQEIKDRRVLLEFLRGGAETSCEIAPQLSSSTLVTQIHDYNDILVFRQNDLYGYPYAVQNQLQFRSLPQGVIWNTYTPAVSVADQLACLKQQLAEMQKSVENLEAALSSAAEQPAENATPAAEAPPQE
jgi:hypothetical protein